MISSQDLTEAQRSAVEQWAREGSQLADIQQRLKGQFGLNVTYMDTRFLVLDLGIEIQSEESADAEAEDEHEAATEPGGPGETQESEPALLDAEQSVSGGGVSVTTHEFTQPDALVSGSVTFSDGEKGVWLIDRMGRPALEMEKEDYQPSEADMIELEKHLRKLLEGE